SSAHGAPVGKCSLTVSICLHQHDVKSVGNNCTTARRWTIVVGIMSSPASARNQPPLRAVPRDPQEAEEAVKIAVASLHVSYAARRVLHDIALKIRSNEVTALIGPSGCGKSTFLRTLNRMNDIVPGARVEGAVTIDGRDIYAPSVDVVDLRRRVGMVFQKSNPFPKSIFSNVAYGLRINRLVHSREELGGRVEASLQAAPLLD